MSETGQPEQYADAARRYRLDSRIATGGMGVVWRATDSRLNRAVAVKVLKNEYAEDETFRQRFETEARHAASLHHPGIAGVFDYQADPAGLATGGAPFLVMELVDGQPLSALLAQARTDGRVLDPDVVRDLMAQAADALGVAHRAGIVHRDVKPANLMVTPEGQVKVTDFGIARAADAAQITRTGAVMGTPQYLAPEQARGNPSVPASDVYALGVVTFECLTGRRPFEADSPVATALAHLQQPVPDLPDTIPADLAAVVQRALSKDPAERYPDGAAFAVALRDPSAAAPGPAPGAATVVAPAGAPDTESTAVLPAVAGAVPAATATPPTQARLETPAPYAGREEPAHRSPWPAVVLVLLMVAAAVLLAWLFLANRGDDTPVDLPKHHKTRTSSATTTSSSPTESSTPPTSTPPTSTPPTSPTSAPTTPTSSAPTTPSSSATTPTTPTTSASGGSASTAVAPLSSTKGAR
ncbi:protein kinase domain-containing protein [Nocardioides panacisoli]|uniref:non-specific serine/threonine protein kinase n=1 Tax=Nocardioides panacisoli TaxID=627624 RepID=A0ABP7ILP5_9ACTN